ITKKVNSTKYMLLSIFMVVAFITGFLFGGSLIYGLSSSKFDDLQNQIYSLQNRNNESEIQNITYYYNETSLSDIYNNVKDSIVIISGEIVYQSFFGTQYSEVQGSGFIYEFENDMFVITNYHVVSGATDIVVTFSNGNSYSGNVLGSDAYSDLAVLTVNAPYEEFKPLKIISSSNLKVGEPVIAIGSPFGLGGTMTTGIISQLGRTILDSVAGNFPIANIIQTSAPINPGNSGGPLLNYQGEVIGITTAIIQDSNDLGFAIPSNTILREIESLVKTGSYNQHSWLGISGVDMSYQIAQKMNVNVTYGWLVSQVTTGGAAEKAGLKGGNQQIRIGNEWVIIGGDIIIAIDGKRMINGDSLMSYLEEKTTPSQVITVTVIRDNQQIDIPVELGTRPNIS
ncbi:MAG: trypsin-like peptidase domain-containing protein, partial [Candidatus Thermoplasmatota archaeon]|nr:trypsin-like peptidase domain-containing protein [Candidatus Thermoplasmatota archaeon]